MFIINGLFTVIEEFFITWDFLAAKLAQFIVKIIGKLFNGLGVLFQEGDTTEKIFWGSVFFLIGLVVVYASVKISPFLLLWIVVGLPVVLFLGKFIALIVIGLIFYAVMRTIITKLLSLIKNVFSSKKVMMND